MLPSCLATFIKAILSHYTQCGCASFLLLLEYLFFFFAFFTFGFSLFRFVYFLIAREMEGEEFGFFFFGDIYFRVEPRVLRKSREGDLCVTFRIISDRFGNISVNGERCCGLLVYGIAEEVRRVRFCRGFRMQMMFDRPSSLRLITFSNGGNVFFGDLVALGVCFLLFWIDTYTFLLPFG